MKNRYIAFVLLFLVLLGLACDTSGSTFTPPPITIPAGAAETAQAVAGQAASAAGTAAVQGGAALATVVAAGTPDIDALREKLAALQPDENGNVSVTITDDEVNQLIQGQQVSEGQTGATLQNPAVTFTGGNIVLAGDVTEPVVARLTVVFRPYISDGLLQFEVTQATLGTLNVPPTLLASAEETLNSTLGAALNNLPAGVQLTAITMGEGTMTLTARREP